MSIKLTMRGAEFDLHFQLEPAVSQWEVVATSPDGRLTTYHGNGYRLTLEERQGDGYTLVEFQLRRAAGETFTLHNYVLQVETTTLNLDRLWLPWFLDRHVEFLGLLRSQETPKGKVRRHLRGEAFTSFGLAYPCQTMADRQIPLILGMSRAGITELAVGLLDQQIETDIQLRGVTHQTKGDQDRGSMRYRLQRPIDGYSLGQVMEHRDGLFVASGLSWFDTLQTLRTLYDEFMARPVRPSPDAAWEPLLAPWGSATKGNWAHMRSEAFSADELFAIMQQAAALGFRGMVNWTGWFMELKDAFKGEQFVWGFPADIGDFVASSNFPDLKGFVRRLKTIGVMSMFWISPWMAGRHTRARAAFQEAVVDIDMDPADPLYNVYTSYLCPRNPLTQQRVVELVSTVMREYELDGLTVDMVDMLPMEPCTANHEHNYTSVGLAMADTLARIRAAVDAVNPNAVLEFRPRYSNISNLYNATAHRSIDSGEGGSYDLNRRHCLLLRSYVPPGVAVHNDPVWWHIEEKNEVVAKMLSTMVVSGVPQVCADPVNMSDDHRRLVKAWLSFYQEHKEDFRYGQLRPVQNDPLFSTIKVERAQKAFVSYASFPALRVPLSEEVSEIYLFNCTNEDALYTFLLNVSGAFSATVHNYDCTPLTETRLSAGDGSLLVDLEVPQGGYIRLIR
jgi:alpha-galactosidase